MHLILDNYGTHTHPKVKEWLAARPRYHLHFTPTSASWLNLVEVFFNMLQSKVVSRGVFRSRQELIDALLAYIRKFSSEHHIFCWTKPAPVLLRKLNYVTGH